MLGSTAHEDKIDGPSPTLSASHSLDWDLPSTEYLGCPQELQQDEVASDFHVPILNISCFTSGCNMDLSMWSMYL